MWGGEKEALAFAAKEGEKDPAAKKSMNFLKRIKKKVSTAALRGGRDGSDGQLSV